MKEYQKPLKRKGLALFPKEKGKTARIRREASEENEPFFGEFSLERKIEFQRFADSTKTSNGKKPFLVLHVKNMR